MFVLKWAARKPEQLLQHRFVEQLAGVVAYLALVQLLLFFKSMTSSWPPRDCAETSVHPNLCKTSTAKTVSTQSVTTAERNTLTKPGHSINLWLVRTFISQTGVWKSKIHVGLSRNRHMRTRGFKKTVKACCRSLTATDGQESDTKRWEADLCGTLFKGPSKSHMSHRNSENASGEERLRETTGDQWVFASSFIPSLAQ